MDTFDEYSAKALYVMEDVEDLMTTLTMRYEVHFKDPHHDIARRFLNEIVGFKAIKEVER